MKTFFKYLARKYVTSCINDLLKDNKDSVLKKAVTIDLWVARLQTIINVLKSIMNRITDDNKVDDDEIKASINEIQELIKTW